MFRDFFFLINMLFFFFLNHIGSNGFLLIDRACIGSFAFFTFFLFHVKYHVSALHVSSLHVYISVFVCLLSGDCLLCSVFVLFCMCLWEKFCFKLLIPFLHKPHWSLLCWIQLICMLDQLFANRLQMHVCNLIIRGWHVAFRWLIGLKPSAVSSKHIFIYICFDCK